MVRTSGGIRISAGKSSKKGGGAASSSGPSTPSGKTGSRGSSRLPPIPHCDAPSWQKPITNFFNAGASSSKDDAQIIIQPEEKLNDIDTETEDECLKGESSTSQSGNCIEETNNPDGINRDNAGKKKIGQNSTKDDEPQVKRRKEEQDKENEDNNNI